MEIIAASMHGRTGWKLDNGALALFVMAGGGHIADLKLKGKATVNPFWVPKWKTMEPWNYRRSDERKYGVKLLAGISGHNVCLGSFGDPSPEEARAGLGCHGEAPIARWRCLKKSVTARRLIFSYGCELPMVRMRLERILTMDKGSFIVRIRERVANLARCDVPFTMCQHVTFAAPFIEPEVTVFDMSATKGRTFPGVFGNPQRLKSDAAFTWPAGPGIKGRVDLRTMGRGRNSDFYANLMHASSCGINRKRDYAWFSAVNPKQGLMVAYAWRRSDFPWLGVWEENRARESLPWDGKELTRGMEFANTPFPVGLRKAVDMGTFQGQPTFRWLPALGDVTSEYSLLAVPVDSGCRGVADIAPTQSGFRVDLIVK
jgi:hypothetical protein